MSHNPLVSVVIPTYNRAGVICRTIKNVFEQSYPNIELIIVDDGSTDETASSLRQFGDQIRFVTQPNAGPAAARNRGIAMSRGEIVAFQDSDDLWKPTKLARQIALLESLDKSVPCCLCNAVMHDLYGDGKEHQSFEIALIDPGPEEGIWLNVTEVLASRFVLFNQTVAIRRQALERAGGFDPGLRYLEDYDLALRLSLQGPWAYIKEPLTIWKGGESNSLSRVGMQDRLGLIELEIKILQRILAQVAVESGDPLNRKYLMDKLIMSRRRARAGRRAETQSWPVRAAMRALERIEHYSSAVVRRFVPFPVVKVVPVGSSTIC